MDMVLPLRASLIALLLLSSCGGATTAPAAPSAEALPWSDWSREAFERARRERRPILLSVQAGWCHWCHVMNDVTYRDPEVVRRLSSEFVLIRADGDARPDLAERYRRYAWPATVFLSPDGEQILALRGYRPPERFRGILDDVLAAHADGRVLEEAVGASEPPAEDLAAIRAMLTEQLDAMYDEEGGGWGRRQRYPFAAPVEHALYRAAVHGEPAWGERAAFTLERYAILIDPVWGGMYQYSVPNVWDRPHFEKIVPVQAGALRAFAAAYRRTGDARWLTHADAIHGYLREHLRADDGAFHASQNADAEAMTGAEFYALDDAGRRAVEPPAVDEHVYASHNGLLIEALVALHVATGRQAPLREAVTAARRILRTHRHASGAFVHDADADDPVRYLADQAPLLAAFVALYQATGDTAWRDEAVALAEALEAGFVGDRGGFVAHTADPEAEGFFAEVPEPVIDNAIAAQALLELAHLTQREAFAERAITALRAVSRPTELRRMGRMVGELLLALEAVEHGHLVLSVVGPADRPETAALHRAALAVAEPTRLVELGRPGQSRYPYPGDPAVFLCTSQACSMPVYDPDELAGQVASFLDR